MNDLITIPKESALTVFSADCGLDPYLAKVREEIDSFVPDVTTAKGRDQIASVAYKVARSKTALDNLGKELVAELKEVPKKIDAERKRMRDLLDAWKDEVRKPLTEWEAAEESRVAGIKARIAELSDLDATDKDSAAILTMLDFAKGVSVDDSFAEFANEAAKAKDAAISRLESALTAAKQREAEQAELERLRAEQIAREQAEREAAMIREAEERARREAEEAAARKQAEAEAKVKAEREAAEASAKAEREAAERRELELKLAAERAEREKQEAIIRAEKAADAERQRIEDEKRREAEAAAAREADKQHKAAINNAAKDALVAAGLTCEQAKAAITAIASGKVPNVKITY